MEYSKCVNGFRGRHDLAALLIGRPACIVCWFNPRVWFAAGKLRHEAEKAADDLVSNRGFGPVVYAATLIALAVRHQAAVSGSMLGLAVARRNRLISSVGAILDGSLRRRAPGRLAVVMVSLAGFVMLAAGLRTAD